MQQPDGRYVVSRDQYDAVLFDLDGVVTNTAKLHAACWKQMFDEYLQKRAGERGEAFRPFDLATDYRLYLDGKPRFDGVRDFLASRGIKLPEGESDDPHKPKRCVGWATARTSWLVMPSNASGSRLTREAFDSLTSCAVTNSKSPSSPRVRTAQPF